MQVYCVFEMHGEECEYIRKDILLGIFANIDSAKLYVSGINTSDYSNDHLKFEYYCYVHKSMNIKNNYTYIGKREDCSRYCTKDAFAGFVIECMEVK